MKKTRLKHIGKIGKRNINAVRKLKEIFMDKGITQCELCGSTFALSFAHKHKRVWYREFPELLADFNQVLLLCVPCHEKIEYNKELTAEIFERLRCN
jgi:hypothetical protein